jgi:AcrR family transcriptional regulator
MQHICFSIEDVATENRTRPGGRSARIQQNVHLAVNELLNKGRRDELTVPLIAARAGVTPSRIDRRWGDRSSLLSDVAAQYFEVDEVPPETGAYQTDLRAWAHQFFEEMSSPTGVQYINDVLVGDQGGKSGACAAYANAQIQQIHVRWPGIQKPAPGEIVNHVVAPILYGIVFGGNSMTDKDVDALVDRLLPATTNHPEADA